MSEESVNPRRDISKSAARLLRSNSRHFIALSILFLFPISLSLVVYPCFHLALFHPGFDFFPTTTQTHLNFNSNEVIVLLVYNLFVGLFFICALATITFSSLQVFFGKPIDFISSIKSIKNFFFPLLSTLIVSQTIFVSIVVVFALVLVFGFHTLQILGLVHDSSFLFLGILSLAVLVPILTWLQVNWSLAYVIAVVESKWGFEALRRSACLVKGKRWVAFTMLLIHGGLMGLLMVCGSMYLVLVGAAKGNQWRSLGVITQTAQDSVMGFWMMKHYLVVNVAVYMYCIGEKLPMEIEDGYVSLPLDDQKKHAIV